MIHLCTCIGGSTSINTSRKRRSGTLSCKNCGGRSSINGKSSSSCLLSTVLELTSLIKSDFTWTKVSKGCRSSSRRCQSSNTINLTKDSKVLKYVFLNKKSWESLFLGVTSVRRQNTLHSIKRDSYSGHHLRHEVHY